MADGPASHRRGWRGIVLAVVLIGLVLSGPLLLHFGQERHDVVDFDIATRFPANQPIVGGEVYAAAVIAVDRPRRQAGRAVRQPPAQPRRLHHRSAVEDVFDPRRAGEMMSACMSG